MKISSSAVWISFGAVGLLTACNAFSPFDHAGGDTQLLSAARACLDRGDTACAMGNYQKLSPNQADIAASETAYAMLDAQGAGMTAFSDFIATVLKSNADIGKGLTKYAEKLASGSGEARRVAIFQAYKQRDLISTNNPQLRGFIQFTAGLALAAELLAEATTGDGILKKANLVLDPSLCPNSNTPPLPSPALGCATNTSCGKPATGHLIEGASADYDPTSNAGASSTVAAGASVAGASATTDLLFYTLNHTVDGFAALGGGGGSLTSISAAFAAITARGAPSSAASNAQCFRALLLDQGIGE